MIKKPIVNKSSKFYLIIFTIIFSIFSLICFQFSQSFELSWNEDMRLHESQQSLSEYWLTGEANTMPFDRGVLFPKIMKLAISANNQNIYTLRFIPTFFYLAAALFFYLFLARKENGYLFGILATFLWATNVDLFQNSIIIAPYSANLFLTIILFHAHKKYDGSNLTTAYHSIAALFSLLTLYVSILPILISTFILVKKYKVKFLKKLFWYIPILSYAIIKSILIYKFRFVERIGGSNFVGKSFFENTYSFFKLFNLNYPLEIYDISQIELILSALFICIAFCSIVFLIKNLIKDKKTEFNQYVLIYLVLSFASYFIMNLMDMREIVIRYYYNLLPIFCISLSNYLKYLYLHNKRIIVLIYITAHAGLAFINLHGYMRTFNSLPMISISEYLLTNLEPQDSICFLRNISGGTEIFNLNESNFFNNKYDIQISKDNQQCKNMNPNGAIYIISLHPDLKKLNPCESHRKGSECIPPILKDELTKRKIVSTKHIEYFQKNREIFITQFSKK